MPIHHTYISPRMGSTNRDTYGHGVRRNTGSSTIMRLILVLWIAYGLITNSINGLESWCRSYFEGFALSNDYNRNSPPIQARIVAGKFKKFILNTQTTLWDIDAVSV